eukprot:gnl/MRDRNA2_/MRDRNA2_56508_c0_seq1.p1 gnl/MRDRNA2_/MRDRNA2_56508_c0~~gnl/MRDRNA2_/MRDRNA2_56508_c0_seq1.p1  ORF type:complete len:352 (-),score=55.24 gnl/MRDRNA2_/MRDRNA2_56508_c0_seq1:1-1056(-)
MYLWQDAASDFQAIDGTAVVHGSRATGLAHENSDVDMLTSLPLSELLDIVSLAEGPGSKFDLIENVNRARVPRVRLNHKATGIEVDVINRESDPHSLNRDAFVCNLLKVDKRVLDMTQRIGNWVRHHKNSMPPKFGYPNSYTFRLIGYHYLMVRPGGALLPPLEAHGTDLDESVDIPYVGQVITGETLFQEWLRHLIAASAQGLCADLRNPSQTGKGWRVVDPSSGNSLTEFKDPEQVINTIVSLARQSSASYERAKRDREIKSEFAEAKRQAKRFNGTELLGPVKTMKKTKLNSLIKVKGKDEATGESSCNGSAVQKSDDIVDATKQGSASRDGAIASGIGGIACAEARL